MLTKFSFSSLRPLGLLPALALSLLPVGFLRVQAAAPYAGGLGDGWSMADSTLQLIGYGMVSASAQTFNIGSAPADMATIASAFGAGVLPTTASDLRLIIPPGLHMAWSAQSPTATLSGTAAGKVSPYVTFENNYKTAVLQVTQDFTDGDSLNIAGLQFANFSALSNPGYLGMDTNNDGTADITDTQAKTVLRGGGVSSQYKGGSGDGWFWLLSQDVGTAVGTRLEGGVRLNGGTRLR